MAVCSYFCVFFMVAFKYRQCRAAINRKVSISLNKNVSITLNKKLQGILFVLCVFVWEQEYVIHLKAHSNR